MVLHSGRLRPGKACHLPGDVEVYSYNIGLQANGVRTLIDLLPLAHLHTNRAVVNSQTTAIEANPESTKQSQVCLR
jgi:hypothetical protein